jgi:hypothetical protein
VVAEHEVVAGPDGHGRVAVPLAVLRRYVGLRDLTPVHEEPPRAHLDGVPGQTHDALDEGYRRLAGIPEDDDVAPLDGLEPVDELVDDDAVPVVEKGLHARSLDPEGLGHEGDEEEAEEDGDGQIVQELPRRPPEAQPRPRSGWRRDRGKVGGRGRGRLEAPGVQAHGRLRLTTRVPAMRSCRPPP